MAADSLLAALHGNYGGGGLPEDDFNTVRGLLDYCKKWIDRLVDAKDLNNPCLQMAGRLKAGANEMEADLERNTDMGREMRDPITRTMEAYRAIADVLEELPEFALDENVDDFLDDLEVFEEERQAVLDAQELIQFQLSGKTKLCPRCGSSGEEPNCLACGDLVRLYPDPKGVQARSEMQARLSGLYAKVYRAYLKVMSGARSLPTLWDALHPLDDHLEDLISTRKQLRRRIDGGLTGQRYSDARTAETLLSGVEPEIAAALRGIERMRGAEQSLRMCDLSRGWEDVFHAAQAIEIAAGRIRRFLGEEEEPSSLEPDDDIVSFSGE